MEDSYIYGISRKDLEKSGATAINPYGNWEVKSYDYNGVQHYGFYTGYISDIALYIANITHPKAGTYLPLTFSRLNLIKPVLPSIPILKYKKVFFEIRDVKINLSTENKVKIYKYILNNHQEEETESFYGSTRDYEYRVFYEDGFPVIQVVSDEEKKERENAETILSKLTEEEQRTLASYFSHKK